MWRWNLVSGIEKDPFGGVVLSICLFSQIILCILNLPKTPYIVSNEVMLLSYTTWIFSLTHAMLVVNMTCITEKEHNPDLSVCEGLHISSD